jgi:hypothetical protein
MAFCAKCGSQVADGSPFCGSCGAPVAQPQTQMPPVAGPVYPPPAGSGGNGAKIALFSLAGLLVIGAVVVLLLGFAVGPKWFVKDDAGTSSDNTSTTTDSGGGGSKDKDTAAIEKSLNTFFDAFATQDGEMMASVFSPSEIKKTLGLDPSAEIDDATYKIFCDGLSLGLTNAMNSDNIASVKFTGLKYSIKVSGNTATATVTGGDMTTVDTSGKKTTQSAADSRSTASEITMVKEGGKWYVSMDSLK